MDQEVLVILKEQLTPEMIEAGEQLLSKLDEIGYPITAAFWLFDREINEWQFTFATPERNFGPTEVYEKVDSVMRDLWGDEADDHIKNIRAIRPDSELAQRLKKIPGVSRTLGRTKFDNQYIDGRFIDDALIYRAA